MARIGLTLLALAGLGVGVFFAARKPPPPIDIRSVGTLGPVHKVDLGVVSYDEEETKHKRASIYRLDIKSNLDRPVQLDVRLDGASHERVAVQLRGESKLLPQGSAKPNLVILPPGPLGPFSGTAVLFSNDVPEWRYEVAFSGEIRKVQRQGRWLTLRPIAVDLGKVRPGEKKPFVATLRNEGTEEITIREWRPLDANVQLNPSLRPGDLIAPGGEKQVGGTVTIPDVQGQWVTRVLISSDSTNAERLQLQLGAVVEPDFTLHPPSTRLDNVYPPRQREFTVQVKAREGLAPFKVTGVKNLARFFEVVSLGADEPAAEQTVRLRVAPGAPHQVVKGHPVRFVVEPPGVELEHKIYMHTHGSISAQPERLNWGTLRRGTTVKEKEVLLATFAGRQFKVTNVQSKNGYFVARLIQSPGVTPRVMVRPAEGLPSGILDDFILIETDDKDTPRLRVHARIEYRR